MRRINKIFMEKKEKTVRFLRVWMCIFYCVALFMGVFFAVFLPGGFVGEDDVDDSMALFKFVYSVLGIGVMLVFVPLALKLMSFKKTKLAVSKENDPDLRGYREKAVLRLVLLTGVMFINLISYGVWQDSTFIFCALIGFAASLACWPTVERLERETGRTAEADSRR